MFKRVSTSVEGSISFCANFNKMVGKNGNGYYENLLEAHQSLQNFNQPQMSKELDPHYESSIDIRILMDRPRHKIYIDFLRAGRVGYVH